jgi:hypothetical protein
LFAVGAVFAGATACGLLVGTPQGLLPGDADVSEDGSGAPPSLDSSVAPDGGIDAGSRALDGAASCDADFDADPINCGWCGHDCMGACAGGSCTAQIVLTASPTSMATGGTALYYTAGSEVWAFDTTTLQPAVAIASRQNRPGAISVRAPYVFWGTSSGTVYRALEDGGGLTPMALNQDALCIVSNSSKLYWWDTPSGSARSVPVNGDGGTPSVAEYTASAGAPGCVNADDAHVVFVTNQALVERDLDSGVATTVTLSQPDTRYALIAGAYTVVLTSSKDDAGTTIHVNAVATGTTTVEEVVSFPSTNVLSMAGDGAGIYWSPQTESRIDGCSDPLCTAGVRHFSPVLLSPPTLLALDPTFIYSPGGGTPAIVRFAR